MTAQRILSVVRGMRRRDSGLIAAFALGVALLIGDGQGCELRAQLGSWKGSAGVRWDGGSRERSAP